MITGRLAKARQFADAAHDVLALAGEADDVADAFVTLAVHAGIAAADVICCVRLGRHARGRITTTPWTCSRRPIRERAAT